VHRKDAKVTLNAGRLDGSEDGQIIPRSSGELLTMYKIARDPLSSLLYQSTLRIAGILLPVAPQARLPALVSSFSRVFFFTKWFAMLDMSEIFRIVGQMLLAPIGLLICVIHRLRS
jgi:hypothetical protein